jgi:hypothetical protein
MAQRHIQLFRNQQIDAYVSYSAARTAAEAQLATLELRDGELALFSYQLGTESEGTVIPSGPVHTLVGVKRTNGIEILANYDELHYDIEQIINGLDSEVTNAVIPEGEESDTTTPVIVTIKQENGKLFSVKVDTTNLSHDFQEIINALDYTHEESNTTTTFNIYATNQENGLISEVVDGTIYFTDGVDANNPGATKTYVDTAINNLDVTNVDVATVTGNVVKIYNVKEVDGKISQNDVAVTLEEVAFTGAAADVSVADADGVITATTVEGALTEIAKEIDAMDLAATDVVALNTDKNALQASKISEVDGKVNVEAAATIVEFNQDISSTNKVATMADLTAAEYAGENAINVNNADNKISLVINPADSVLSQDANGLKTNISLQYVSVNDTEGTGTHKVIQLIGTNGDEQATPVVLGTVDATDFVKDSFLESANIVSGTWSEDGNTFTQSNDGSDKAIELVWKVVTRDGDTSDDTTETTYINVESLIDAYTVGNNWIVINETTNTISHAEVGAAGTYGNENDVNAMGTTTFVVPTLTIDAAGHVTAAANKTVTIDLSTTTANEVLNATNKFVAVQTSAVADSNDYIITSQVQTQPVASATDEANGLATAKDVRDFTEHIDAGLY